jgi:hypothetical protein
MFSMISVLIDLLHGTAERLDCRNVPGIVSGCYEISFIRAAQKNTSATHSWQTLVRG